MVEHQIFIDKISHKTNVFNFVFNIWSSKEVMVVANCAMVTNTCHFVTLANMFRICVIGQTIQVKWKLHSITLPQHEMIQGPRIVKKGHW